MTFRRRPNEAEKTLIALTLRNSGIKARLKVCRFSLRIVFDGGIDQVAATLNELGFCNASGAKFDRYSFNTANEVSVYAA